jgi:ATP-binding cassette subfamily B protein RaxB
MAARAAQRGHAAARIVRPADLLELSGARRTPMIRQAEAAECALASLAMVAGYHGLNTDMATLRRRFSVSLKGSTLKTLMQTAEQSGFIARPLRAEIEHLEQLPLPAILHWDLNHFVVLTRVTHRMRGRRFHIHDPAIGPQLLFEAEFSRRFSGVVLELTPSANFQPRSDRSLLRISQLWSKMTGLWSSLRNVLLLSIVLQLVTLAMPFYLQLAVDTVFPSVDKDLLLMLALGFGGLALVNMLTGWLRALILTSLGNSLSYQIIVNLYRHLLRLPLPWFEKRHVGDVISRFGSTGAISTLLSQGLVAALIDGAMAVLTLALMCIYSPLLAVLALVASTIFAGLKLGSFRALRTRNINTITAIARENSAFIESIRGVAAIKAFGQEGNRQRTWQQLKADAVNAQIRLGRFMAGFDAGGQFVLALERIVFVYIAIRLAIGGGFTVGMIFAFQAYKQQFLDASTRLIDQAIQYKLLDVHLSRIADIALSRPESDAARSESDERVAGAINVVNLCFRYGTGEPEVLRGVDLEIAPGEMIALVGPSGGGKTTLLKIMMGLFEPTSGQVLIDGHPLASHGLRNWRRQIGSVSQDDALFAGSLAENIAFFDPEIDMARVVEAAERANIHADIEAMPMRYDTLVGDMGSALSGGQKQRILLARALYPDPAVLFIDEGTAHLDPATEAKVMATVEALPVTRIISAHRPVPIARADRIFTVIDGNVVETVRPAPAGANNGGVRAPTPVTKHRRQGEMP